MVNGASYKSITALEGQDFLSFKNYMDGSDQVVSQGRFLNNSYDEMLIEADMPEKNIRIEGVTTKVSETLWINTKSVKDRSTGAVTAVIQEAIHLISKEEFEKYSSAI